MGTEIVIPSAKIYEINNTKVVDNRINKVYTNAQKATESRSSIFSKSYEYSTRKRTYSTASVPSDPTTEDAKSAIDQSVIYYTGGSYYCFNPYLGSFGQYINVDSDVRIDTSSWYDKIGYNSSIDDVFDYSRLYADPSYVTQITNSSGTVYKISGTSTRVIYMAEIKNNSGDNRPSGYEYFTNVGGNLAYNRETSAFFVDYTSGINVIDWDKTPTYCYGEDLDDEYIYYEYKIDKKQNINVGSSSAKIRIESTYPTVETTIAKTSQPNSTIEYSYSVITDKNVFWSTFFNNNTAPSLSSHTVRSSIKTLFAMSLYDNYGDSSVLVLIKKQAANNGRVYTSSATFSIYADLLSYSEVGASTDDSSNTLLLEKTTLNTTTNSFTSTVVSNILSAYGGGKEMAEIKCSIGKYLNTSGQIAIDPSSTDCTFSIGQTVIPYALGASGDIPMSRYQNGDPKKFAITGIKIDYNGALWQTLTLQEVSA